MGFVGIEPTPVRTINISGGYTPDPDWLADFDAAGARSSGPKTYVPTSTGRVGVFWQFRDMGGAVIAPLGNSRIDLEFLALPSDSPTGADGNNLVEVARVHNHSPRDLGRFPLPLVGPIFIAVRTSQLVGVPVLATELEIVVQVG